ncbi:MAG TPA: TIR domain-containing protein [Anaerolineales bacterium]|nr:TIR domain-containing protein [Anaerolineales bacterium]
MANGEKRSLKVFLCHASGDKPPVRDLYKQLTTGGVDAWLDQEKLLPGQDWRLEIPRAVQEADVVVVCLSKKSITKEGYVQKEIKFALDIAEEKPEGAIFLIPARLEECVVPDRLSRWQWVDLYEENGFIKLLRSLKLRANAVGAIVEPISYEDADKERERRLDQLYMEGLAAFYTEDWDRACHCFQTILSEQPNHRKAAEKLAEAECQRHLTRLYAQATEAYRSENWQSAIGTLEELSQKSADYRDAAQLLRDARKQKQLKGLYAEAKALHTAQKWQAVIKVFKQISVIEPNYPDTEGLLSSAQKEAAELERLAKLDEQYNHALREMESGNWYEARRLLESVHKSQTGFLETEKLFRKVEDEISREEEKRKQNDQINTLYEQARGLFRAKKWRNALDKLEQIRKLDEHFPDPDGITEKVQKELEREEQEADRQDKLAALYAEAARLLREAKYQEALDKWQEVKAIDPKYPDRQWVQRTARKGLTASLKPMPGKSWIGRIRPAWIRVGSIILIVVITTITTLYANRKYYDNFNFPVLDGKYNTQKWSIYGENADGSIYQVGGLLVFEQHGPNEGQGISLRNYEDLRIQPDGYSYLETKLRADNEMNNGSIGFGFRTSKTFFSCDLGNNSGRFEEYCWREDAGTDAENYRIIVHHSAETGKWYVFLIEIDGPHHQINFSFDGQKVASYQLAVDESLPIGLGLHVWAPQASEFKGYVDYVKMFIGK